MTCIFSNSKLISPQADFNASPISGSPTSGVPPLTVEFTNLSTGDYDECKWDFGDGRTHSGCNNPTHEYEDEGHYTVSLTVKGPGGQDTMTVERCVTVANYHIFLPGVMTKK